MASARPRAGEPDPQIELERLTALRARARARQEARTGRRSAPGPAGELPPWSKGRIDQGGGLPPGSEGRIELEAEPLPAWSKGRIEPDRGGLLPGATDYGWMLEGSGAERGGLLPGATDYGWILEGTERPGEAGSAPVTDYSDVRARDATLRPGHGESDVFHSEPRMRGADPGAPMRPRPRGAPPRDDDDGDRPSAIAEAAGNFLPSAGRLAADLTAPIHSPIRTAGGLFDLVKGVVKSLPAAISPFREVTDETVLAVGRQLADRYGGADALEKTFREDPAGLAGDIAGVLTGGAGLAVKAGGTAGKVGRIAAAAGRAGEALNVPAHLARAGGLAARGVGRGAAAVSGAVTGEGGDVLRGAFRAGRDADAGSTFRGTMRPGDSPDVDRVVEGRFGQPGIETRAPEIPTDGAEVLAWDRARREAEAARITSAQLNKTAKPPPLRVHPAISPETWERLPDPDKWVVAEAWRRQLPGARRQILDQLADTPRPDNPPSGRTSGPRRPFAEVAKQAVPWGRVRDAISAVLDGERVGGVRLDRSPGNATATKRIRKLLEEWDELPADQGRTVAGMHRLGRALNTTGGKRPPDVVRRAREALDGILADVAPEYGAAMRRQRSAASAGKALGSWTPRSGFGRLIGGGSAVGAFWNPALLGIAGATSPRLAGEIAHLAGRLPIRQADPRLALAAALGGRYGLADRQAAQERPPQPWMQPAQPDRRALAELIGR